MKLKEVRKNKDLSLVDDICVVCGARLIRAEYSLIFFCCNAPFSRGAHYSVDLEYDQDYNLFLADQNFLIKNGNIFVTIREDRHTLIYSGDNEPIILDFAIIYDKHFEENVLNNLIL